MQWDADLPADLVERVWQSPTDLLAQGDQLQDKVRCSVVRLDHAAGSFSWKHHTWGSTRRTAARSLSLSVARKSWNDARLLYAAGVPTPRPRAFLERRLGPFQTDSFLLTDFVPGTSLYRLLRTNIPARDAVEQLARQVADIWQQLDVLCVWHNDFKTENLLVDPQGKVWLIDFEKMRRFRDREAARRRQVRDAAMLLHPRNWRRAPWAAEVFRQAILATPAAAETIAGPLGREHPLRCAVPSANRTAQLVSVLILCAQGSEDVGPCVESVRDLADEIIVAAAVPLDGSASMARDRHGCRVIWRDCDDRLEFEAWAQRQARFPWVLQLLPGERVDAELGKRIQDVVASEPDVDAYHIPRFATYCGRRLRYGTVLRDAPVRLFRKDTVELVYRDGEVDLLARHGRSGRLPFALWCELNCRPGGYVQSVVEGTVAAARVGRRRRTRGSLPRALATAAWQFVWAYFFRRGFQDGWPGLHVACLGAWGRYLRESLLWEIAETGTKQAVRLPGQAALTLYDSARWPRNSQVRIAGTPSVDTTISAAGPAQTAARRTA